MAALPPEAAGIVGCLLLGQLLSQLLSQLRLDQLVKTCGVGN